VLVKTGTDHVRLFDETQGKTRGNTISTAKVPVKVIVDHDVSLFNETEMTAIVGVGPGKFEEREKRMVHHLGVRRFMVCFQENAAANGFWTWEERGPELDGCACGWQVVLGVANLQVPA